MSDIHAEAGLAEVRMEQPEMSRGTLILKGALAAAAVYGVSTVAPFVGRAFAQTESDVEIVNFALTLEYLEADFYRRAVRDAGLSGELRTLAREFGENEQEHVDALSQTAKDLGGTPVEKPSFTFPVNDRASFLDLAVTLEDTGVAAYNGAAPQIKSKEVLAAAGGIVQVEARHAAAVRLQADQEPAPRAFDRTLSETKVLDAVQPFIEG